MTSSDVFLATGPIYHAAGSYAFLSLHAGSTVSVLPKFDGLSWLEAVDRHRVTSRLMVPAHFIRVLEVPAGRVGRISTCRASVSSCTRRHRARSR